MLAVHASSSAANCYSWGPLLIECGLPVREIMRRCTPKVCLITHEHKDHCKAAHDLARLGVTICGTPGTLEALGINGLRLLPGLWCPLIDGFKVLAFPTVHDAAEPCGFVIAKDDERVLFATDTAEINYNFKNLTEMFVECNYSEQALVESSLDLSARIRIARSHMSLERLVEFLGRQDLRTVRRITLLHLSDGHASEAMFKQTIEAVTGVPVAISTKRDGGKR